jgi:N-acetylglutamate synthase-like GNAT family acetyltransferase
MMKPTEGGAQPRITLWLLDLDQPAMAGPALQSPVVFTRAGPEIAQELAQVMELDNTTLVQQRFDQGQHCYVGKLANSPVTYGWVTFDEEEIGEVSLRIRLKVGEAYIWNCATLPAYRRQHLYSALLAYIVASLRQQELRRVWIGTDHDNLFAQQGIARAGFQATGDIMINQTREPRHAWMRARPTVHKQLALDTYHALFGEREDEKPL